MTDFLDTLRIGLIAATGLHCGPAPKPEGIPVPCITFQVVSDPMQDHNHSAGASIHMSRVQINHIGDYEVIRPYVQIVQNYLEGNKTDFLSARSDGVYLERKEAEDIWTLIRGYYIQHR